MKMFGLSPKQIWQNRSTTLRKCGVLFTLTFAAFTVLCALALLATYTIGPSESVNVVYVYTNESGRDVNPKFLSIALDTAVLRSNFRDFDMTNPKLKTLMKALAPGFFRVGGNAADMLIFSSENSKKIVPEEAQFYTFDDVYEYYVDECDDGGLYFPHDPIHFTMHGDQWLKLNKFTKECGFEMLFDLNVLLRKGKVWDPTNTESLIKFSSDNELDLNWQLGNEPNAFAHYFGRKVSARQLGSDFRTLKNILNKYPRYNTSLLVGPDTQRPQQNKCRALNYFRDFLKSAGDVVDAVSFHQYYMSGVDASMQDFVNHTILDELKWQICAINAVTSKHAAGKPIWLTETSSCYHGGALFLSDRFIATFMWLDKLGLSALGGIDLVVRQSIVRGSYALINENYDPTPDWWVSYLYKMLVGPKVVKCTSQSSENVRIYCHCGKVCAGRKGQPPHVIFALNLDNRKHGIRVEGLFNEASVNPRVHDDVAYAYILTADNQQLTSKYVRLNGERLELTESGEIPLVKPILIKVHPRMEMPAYSLAFWVIPTSNGCH